MPTVYPLISDSKQQYTDANGVLASGYQMFVYTAGSSTKVTSYLDSDGAVANPNPIILNARGETPSGVYVESGTYKLVLAADDDTDPPASAIWTRDNLTPGNDTSVASSSQWEASGITPTFVSATSFTMTGDQRTPFHTGRRVKSENTAGTVYSTVTVVAYADPTTTVTVVNDGSSVLDSGLSATSYGLITVTNTSSPYGALEYFGKVSGGAATYDFTGLEVGYDYEFIGSGVRPTTNAAYLWIRTSVDGITWDSGASDYGSVQKTIRENTGSSSAEALTGDDTTAQIVVNARQTSSNADWGGMFFRAVAYNPALTTAYTIVSIPEVSFVDSGNTYINLNRAIGDRKEVGAVTGVRFLFDNSDILEGTIEMWRRKHQ